MKNVNKNRLGKLMVVIFVITALLSALTAQTMAAGTKVETYLINDNFNSEATGSAPAGYILNVPEGHTVAIAEVPSSSNKCLKFEDVDTVSSTADKTFEPQTGVVVLEYKYMVTSLTDFFGPRLMSGDVMATVVRSKDGEIKFRNNVTPSKDSWVPLKPLAVNTWYSIKVLANTETDTVDIYVDGKLLADDAPFVAPVDYIDGISFGTPTTYTDDTPYENDIMYIDDVQVYNQASVVTVADPEPAASESPKTGDTDILLPVIGLVMAALAVVALKKKKGCNAA